MIKIFLVIILLVFASADIIEDANNAYIKGDVKKAIKLYKKLARDGSNEAYFKLGVLYYKGKYIKRDLFKAMKFFKNAADYGHDKAKYNMGIIYSLKQYRYHSYKKAYNIFLNLAQSNYPKGQNKVGIYLIYGLGVEKNYKLAVQWLEQSYFENRYKPAGCYLAYMYAFGKGVFVNLGRARKLAQWGFENNILVCQKLYKDFNLKKYKIDKGFKFGYYK
jgi:TPR repeat protein